MLSCLCMSSPPFPATSPYAQTAAIFAHSNFCIYLSRDAADWLAIISVNITKDALYEYAATLSSNHLVIAREQMYGTFVQG